MTYTIKWDTYKQELRENFIRLLLLKHKKDGEGLVNEGHCEGRGWLGGSKGGYGREAPSYFSSVHGANRREHNTSR